MLPISESKFWRSQLLVCVCKFEFAIRSWIEADWACRKNDTLFYTKHFEGTVRQRWRGQIFLTYPIYPWLMILSGIRFIPNFLGGHRNLKFYVRSAPTLNYHLCVRTVCVEQWTRSPSRGAEEKLIHSRLPGTGNKMKEKDKWHASYLLRLELLRFLFIWKNAWTKAQDE